MRKINDINDLHRFIDDLKTVRPSSAVKYFGIGQNDDICLGDWHLDGTFATQTTDDGELFQDGAPVFIDANKAQTAAEFIDGILTNYHYPFYIVDRGANYTWL